jgi:D-alanine-D-alanine ligase
MAASKHVAVLMGGWSSERPVSLSTGKACADALEAAGYTVTRIDVDRSIASVLDEMRPDVVFNALHGPFGEDGTIQGMLEILDIPYTHSGVLASALAMDKARAKLVAAAAGVHVTDHVLTSRAEAAKAHAMEPPYVVKPVSEGSSFGVVIVPEGQSSPPQSLMSEDWTHGETVMVERYIPGRELTCAVMGAPGEEVALEVTEIVPVSSRFYDYESKYEEGGSKHILPAKLLPFVYQNIRTLALQAHRAIGCRGVSRSDFRFDEDGTGEVVWLEVNTQPGMTPTSLVPELAELAGYDFEALVSWMVEDASCGR